MASGDPEKADAPIAPFPVKYPEGVRLGLIVASLAAAVFLCALVRLPALSTNPHGPRTYLELMRYLLANQDETIIATAIPRITDDFKAINDIGWYGSA